MRRRMMSSGNGANTLKQYPAGKQPLPPQMSSSVSNSFPQGQTSAAGHQVSNPIKPGGSLHRAGTLHLGKKKY